MGVSAVLGCRLYWAVGCMGVSAVWGCPLYGGVRCMRAKKYLCRFVAV